MEKNRSADTTVLESPSTAAKRILFATFPADGHFNPLTGLAVHLQKLGHDVRWYTSTSYADKLTRLGIPHFPLKRAKDISGNPDELFPQRKDFKGKIKKLTFDLTQVFVLRGPEYFEDIKEIRRTFPFDAVVCDCAFTAIPYLAGKLDVPVLSIGVLPLIETSKDLPPVGLGLAPSSTFWGRRKQDALRFIADRILFRKPNRLMASLLREHGVGMEHSNLFDACARTSTMLLQIGTPGFEYRRSDLSRNVRFIGALLPHSSANKPVPWSDEKLARYKSVILVTQGTVEKDVSKLLMPTLEAFQNSDYLVVMTTGGSRTRELREKYPCDNIVIEDFISFSDIMPHASVYITNGGYGGVMLSIKHGLPMVAAGVHEGKNEINARVGYFKIGIDLGTERPTPSQLRNAVEKVLTDQTYSGHIQKLNGEFANYDPEELCAQYLEEALANRNV